MITLRRTFDFSIIVALSVMTVLATMTVMHDANIGQSSYVDRVVGQGIKKVAQWVSEATHRATPASAPATQPTSSVGHPLAVSTGLSLPTGAPDEPLASDIPPTWSGQDVQHLTNILTEMVNTISPSDWRRLATAGTETNGQAATQDVEFVLGNHLSSTDKEWVLSKFTGPQAFDQGDIELLQQAFNEAKAELSPYEQTVLEQQLHKFLNGDSAGFTGSTN